MPALIAMIKNKIIGIATLIVIFAPIDISNIYLGLERVSSNFIIQSIILTNWSGNLISYIEFK